MDDGSILVDFTLHKRRLTEIFFPNHKPLISRRSAAYDEFWKFLLKLQNVIRSNLTKGMNDSLTLKKRKLNVLSTNHRLEDYIRHSQVENNHRSLPEANLLCFHLIFDMFYDFLQKRKFARLVKLRTDQSHLPIASFRTDILNVLSHNQVVVVAGDTGCGKSTQVPQYLYFGNLDKDNQPCGDGFRRIAVTQPRRIACISLAARVSSEMLNEKGSKVGYQVRFERSRTKATQILFLTEGLLLRQMQSDPFLNDYDALVLDEVHERHWQTDCLLGLVKCLIKSRLKLRVILMSATINVNLFSTFFNNCPVIQVPGRLYPIDLFYVPLTQAEIVNSGECLDPAPYMRLLHRIDATYPVTERGDLLVFVPGMADIQSILEPAKVYAEQTKRWIILPLHSTLSADEQEKVFHIAPDGVRKCILSTNIAETSLTIDGIRFVADSGKVKELSWDTQARMRCLKEFPLSKASADQRKGRAGRTGPGVCYRFYTQEDYDSFESFSIPEIRRVPLETLVLQMMVMGLPDIKRFPFIEPPQNESLDEALEILKLHGALEITSDEKLNENTELAYGPLKVTPLGEILANLPIEFSLGRTLIVASLFSLVETVLNLVAGMAVQCPLLSHTMFHGAEQTRRMEALDEFESDHGDMFTISNVFTEWIKMKSEFTHALDTDNNLESAGSKLSTRRWCRRIGVLEQRLHEMVRLRSQFAQLLRDCGVVYNKGNDVQKCASKSKHYQKLNRARRTERIRTKKRRILTLQDNTIEDSASDDDRDQESDESDAAKLRKWLTGSYDPNSTMNIPIQDLELVLCHNLSSLAESADSVGDMTQGDLQLLKVVIAGGLYPNMAIGDTANTYRVANRGGVAGAGADMVFHTKSKGFVTLNPNDVFVRKPDALLPDSKQWNQVMNLENCKFQNPDKYDNDDAHSKPNPLPAGFSFDHQLLMYLDVMETKKPFLVNTMRVPALPTLLLYSREIDTNSDVTRIVFDGWLEVRSSDTESIHRALATTIWLRTTMEYLMQLELAEITSRQSENLQDSGQVASIQNVSVTKSLVDETNTDKQQIRKLQRFLAHSLAAFLAGRPGGAYSLRRLLAADMKQLYRKYTPHNNTDLCSNSRPKGFTGPSTKLDYALPEPEPASGIKFNDKKGGYQVTHYLNVDSLCPEENSCQLEVNPTYSCELSIRLKSQTRVATDSQPSTVREPVEDTESPYIICKACQESLRITGSAQTTILRHRHSCRAS